MKSIIGSIIVLFLSTATLHAQALQRTQHLEGPFSGIVGCRDQLALAGVIYNVVHITRSAKDNSIAVEIQGGPRGDAFAINLTTGERYNIVGHTLTRLQFSPNIIEKFSYVNQFKIVGLYTVHYTYHVNFVDSYDKLTASVDNLRILCDD